MTQNEVTNTTECLVVDPSFEHGLEQTVIPGTGLMLVAPTVGIAIRIGSPMPKVTLPRCTK